MLHSKLPDNARVWVYQSDRRLTADENIVIASELNNFIEDWTSHRAEVRGEGHLLHSRFIVLLADEEVVKLGGCSIDSSVRFIKAVGERYKINFFDRQIVAYKHGKEVLSTSLTEFEQLMKQGIVDDNTIVYNNLVQTKHDLLNKWEIPYGDSWLKNLALAHTSFNSIL